MRLGTHALLIALILLVAWGLRQLYLVAQVNESNVIAISSPILPNSSDADGGNLPDLVGLRGGYSSVYGITRLASIHTDAPSISRSAILTYTVETGDTLMSIAGKFGLLPETLLWSNQFVLGDNPHSLRPGQILTILPINGTYHRWSIGDSLLAVAKFYGVSPEDIVNFAGNNLDPDTLGDWSNPNIPPGTWLVVPGGVREYVSWSAPEIPRENPATAKVLGPGACETVPDGVNGKGVFIWPNDNHFLAGFGFSPETNHPAVDLAGNEGESVFAADSGVVVYAGWNDWGYGYMVVINHGNGWQTLYAHLSAFYVACGQNVYQGNIIAAIGSTGNAAVPNLHFELMYNGVKVNPLDYLP